MQQFGQKTCRDDTMWMT